MKKKSHLLFLFISIVALTLTLSVFSSFSINPFILQATYNDNDPCGLKENYNELDTYLATTLPTSQSDAIDVRTRGTITNIAKDSSYQYGYMQRTNPITRIESSIYLYRMPLSPTLEVGDVIDVEAKMFSYYGLPEITTSYTSLTKLSVPNPYPAVPYELDDTNYSSFVVEDNLSKLVSVDNITITSVGSDISTNSYNIKVVGNINGVTINIILLTFSATETNLVASTLRSAMNNNQTININRANIYYSYNVCYLHIMNSEDIVVNEVTPPEEDNTLTLDLYAINDFHGAINKTSSQPGIEAVGGYIKTRINDDENTLAINSGDMWQGNIESNFNYGELLTKISDNVPFAAMSIGNHEFDWGDEYIISNKNLDASNENKTKLLGANIYNYVNGNATTHASNLCDEYVIKTMPNGLKVGIIGVIGKDQITSILSPMVEDYTFLDPTNIVINLATELRVDEGCDVVILSAHTDQKSLLKASDYVSDATNITNHVDAIFCAHTHKDEVYMINRTPIVQGYGNGEQISNIKLSIDESNEISVETYKNINYSTYSGYSDEEINDIIATYTTNNSEFMNTTNRTLGQVSGTFSRYNSLSNMVCRASYEYAKEEYDISYVLTNAARSDLAATSSLTYGTLFTSLPFENAMVVADVSGSDLKKELDYTSTYFYRADKEAIDTTKTYRILCLDYVLYHQNSNRQFNYFPSHEVVADITKDNEIYIMRDIVADYISDLGTVYASDYYNSLPVHDRDLITSSIS